MHYADTTELVLESGYLKSQGRTPHNTMRTRRSVDVRDNGESPWIHAVPGVFVLSGRAP